MNIRLEKIAQELLMEEDCVVIPEFGGFVTHYQPATLEPTKNIIIPPGKSISFNAKLSKNDGLLAQSIAVKTGLSYNDSLKAVNAKVSFWQKELAKTNFLEIDGLGSFVLNKEGNLLFEQFNESNFANTSFGLTNVHATPVDRVGLTQRLERSLDKKKASPKVFKVITRSAVAVLLFGLIGFGGYKADQAGMDLSILNVTNLFSSDDKNEGDSNAGPKPLEYQDVEKVLSEEEQQMFVDRGHFDEPANLEVIKEIQEEKAAINAKFEEAEPIVESKVETVVETTVSNNRGSFHVIAGCFGVKSNARKMVRKLKKEGFSDAEIVGFSKSGLHRVAYGSYTQKVAALKALAKAKLTHNSSAWLSED